MTLADTVPVEDTVRILVRRPRRLGLGTWLLWSATLLLATLVCVIIVGWVVPIILNLGTDLPSPRNLHFNALRRLEMVLHAVAGVLALLIGPWQLLPTLRAARPDLHRALGRVHVVVALVSAVYSLALLPKIPSYGAGYVLIVMGTLWIVSTVLGVVTVRRGDIAAHRRWMLRSYSLAWGAVSIRLFHLLLTYFDVSFVYKYPAVVWLAFLSNVVLAEVIVRRTKVWA